MVMFGSSSLVTKEVTNCFADLVGMVTTWTLSTTVQDLDQAAGLASHLSVHFSIVWAARFLEIEIGIGIE